MNRALFLSCFRGRLLEPVSVVGKNPPQKPVTHQWCMTAKMEYEPQMGLDQ